MRVQYDINGVLIFFTIDASGKVSKEDGTVVCETGGEVCLAKWVES